MKIKHLTASCLLIFSQLSYAAFPANCPSFTNCSVNEPCHSQISAGSGKCFKLSGIAKGKKYSCEKTGFTTFYKVEYASAKSAGLAIVRPNSYHLELDAMQLTQPFAEIIFNIISPGDRPDSFTITCR